MTVHNPAFHLVFYQMKQKQPNMEFSHRKTFKNESFTDERTMYLYFVLTSVSKVHQRFGKQSKVVPVHHKPIALSGEKWQAHQ